MEEHLLSSDQNNEYYDLENHVENLNLDSENEIENTETKKKFIYDTNITTDEFLLTFNSIKQNHHINQNTSNDLIRLINAILPKEIKLKMNYKYDILKSTLQYLCLKCEKSFSNNNSLPNFNSIQSCENCSLNTLINYSCQLHQLLSLLGLLLDQLHYLLAMISLQSMLMISL